MQYYFFSDEAVSANECVLSPYKGRNIGHTGPRRDSFNYHLYAMRQTIERAFGILLMLGAIVNHKLNRIKITLLLYQELNLLAAWAIRNKLLDVFREI